VHPVITPNARSIKPNFKAQIPRMLAEFTEVRIHEGLTARYLQYFAAGIRKLLNNPIYHCDGHMIRNAFAHLYARARTMLAFHCTGIRNFQAHFF